MINKTYPDSTAFPYASHEGMNKREYFAVQLMGHAQNYWNRNDLGFAQAAEDAVFAADILIAELNKEKKNGE